MRYRYQAGEKVYDISLERQGNGYRAAVDGWPYMLEVLDSQPGQLSIRFEGRPMTLFWANDGERKWVSMDGCTFQLSKPSAHHHPRPGERNAGDQVRAPMPALVRSIEVAEGDRVTKGQTLFLLEAMKMEIRLQAPRDGRVQSLTAQIGQQVERDQVLIEIVE
jgi:biotin carboxyl carrier protein